MQIQTCIFGQRNLLLSALSFDRKPQEQISHKKNSYFSLYWLCNKDPYNAMSYPLYKWVV